MAVRLIQTTATEYEIDVGTIKILFRPKFFTRSTIFARAAKVLDASLYENYFATYAMLVNKIFEELSTTAVVRYYSTN